jgi:hypothetical protein
LMIRSRSRGVCKVSVLCFLDHLMIASAPEDGADEVERLR